MPTYKITKPYTIISRPILFNAENVRAILKGTKTQTRRVIKIDPKYPESTIAIENGKITIYKKKHGEYMGLYHEYEYKNFPYQKGDFLWVRESIRKRDVGCANATHFGATYLADFTPVMGEGPHGGHYLGRAIVQWKWKRDTRPSIHMPRWASRITLEITEVRAEQIQQISYEDIRAEGIEKELTDTSIQMKRNFMKLWDSINAKRGYPWESNPWVWIISFEVKELNNE